MVFVQHKKFFVRKARRRVGRVVDLKVPNDPTGTSSESYPTIQDVTKIFRTLKLVKFATNPSCLTPISMDLHNKDEGIHYEIPRSNE
jgi:hypothetical protein